MSSRKPPSRLYILAAIVIAVVLWLVLGTPGYEGASVPTELARMLVRK